MKKETKLIKEFKLGVIDHETLVRELKKIKGFIFSESKLNLLLNQKFPPSQQTQKKWVPNIKVQDDQILL